MTEFISRLFIISVLSFPALSFAITIPGNIHPERYTFFLTDRGGEMLREMNDAAVSVKLNNKVGFSAEAQSKAAAANISPLLYAASPLEQNFIRYDSKPVKALTCLVTTRTMPGQNKNYTWEETYCLDETGAAYIGTKGWPSRAIVEKSCEAGVPSCPVYLGLNNDPPTMRNDAAQYIPYNSKRVSRNKESNSQPKPAAGEMVAEQDGYVVNYVKGSSCADNKLVVKNTSSGKTAEIAGLNGCSFDPRKNAVIIFPQNEYVGVYSGPTNASEEIASVDLP
ncbi:hypothetical protein UXP41_06540 [Enterobacter hormaechei]|jgi:hypothetical protein|uniref:Uncharacterized protein n=2 Tax=Enterobacteriaceae TaxID=543 RepID=A0A949Q8Z5_9ENTR|nr:MULTISPECIES: hypothetical protein [Enterobacteriaceae]EGJ5029863.1 hypothetical protein [Escherichia coli]MBT1912694.1 hypothetical protein [Enterobacter hormaechei subsp. xiangfangensis]AMG52078.1 hypothetical protein AL524_02625 [Citrobacter amalonaticus]EGJ6441149.1 hypothetical protein [Escherichia coli]EGQ5286835.1 hypothetical protein [Enterobacter hormaechei]